MKLVQTVKEKFLNKQFITFGIIGVINTLSSQLFYMLFVFVKLNVGIASILGDALSMIGSYFMNMHFTYHKKVSWKSAVTFPISYLPGMIISAVIVLIVVDWCHGPEMWAKLISLPLYIPVNYLVMTFIVNKFGGKSSEK